MNIPTINESELPFGLSAEAVSEIIEKSINASNTLTAFELEVLEVLKPAQVNPCGDCNMCCIAPSIGKNEIDGNHIKKPKPPCVGCEHLTSKGCGVYETRPEVCKSYLCGYAIGAVRYSPLDCGVAWVIQQSPENGLPILVGHSLNAAKTMNDPRNIEVMRNALMSGEFFSAAIKDDKEVFCVVRPNSRMPIGEIHHAKFVLSDAMRQTPDISTLSVTPILL